MILGMILEPNQCFVGRLLKLPDNASSVRVSFTASPSREQQTLTMSVYRGNGKLFASSDYKIVKDRPEYLAVDLARTFRIEGRKLVGIEGEWIKITAVSSARATIDGAINIDVLPTEELNKIRESIAQWQ